MSSNISEWFEPQSSLKKKNGTEICQFFSALEGKEYCLKIVKIFLVEA